jgi:fatty acid desaturase
VFILGSISACVYYPSAPVFILAFLIVSSRQLALTHLVHDASHYQLMPNRVLNDWFSDFFLAAPVLITTESYRVQHLLHHKHLGRSNLDTDTRAWYSISGWQFVKRSLFTLIGWEAVTTFFSYVGVSDRLKTTRPTWSLLLRRLILTGVSNGLLLAYCLVLGNVWIYFFIWILPLFTLTMYLLTLRVLVEHQKESYAINGCDNFDLTIEVPLTRTVKAGFFGRFFLGSMNFFYHHEHHLAPSIRYGNLPRLHKMLIDKGYYDLYPEALGSGYLPVLIKLIRPSLNCVSSTEDKVL